MVGSGKKEEVVENNVFRVVSGPFEVLVVTAGELQASSATSIEGPSELRSRSLRLNDILIQDLIPEGTIVDSGDYVAELDRSEIDNALKDVLDNLEVAQSEVLRTRLDTTLQLTQLRENLRNLKFNVEESQIAVEQSVFEPPATIRQVNIELEKAERAYDQAFKNYELQVEQYEAQMREAEVEYEKVLREKEEMESVIEKFTIYSPAPGMIIYYKEGDTGNKRVVGSTINSWDLTIAELPNLMSLNSITYVNEIDVDKIRIGQTVRVGFDAFPEKTLPGRVIDVSNVGYQLPNTDSKVFEVLIEVLQYDSDLKPAMTTSNFIVISSEDEVLSIPYEFISFEDDGNYVYDEDGNKIEIIIGAYNETHIKVLDGIKEGKILIKG